MTLNSTIKKLSAHATAYTAIGAFLFMAYSAFTKIGDIHAEYATKNELRTTYFQTRVDNFENQIDDLSGRVEFYRGQRAALGANFIQQALLDELLTDLLSVTAVSQELQRAIQAVPD